MASKQRTFKKYEENRKKLERLRKRVHRKSVSNLKKIARQKETSRNKRIRTYNRKKNKYYSSKSKSNKSNQTPVNHDSLTSGEISSFFFTLLLLALFFILWFKWGFWKSLWTTIIILFLTAQISADLTNKSFDISGYLITAIFTAIVILCFSLGICKGVLVSLVVLVLFLILYALFCKNETPEDAKSESIIYDTQSASTKDHISFLHGLLSDFDMHKEIINTSDNPDTVKESLDCLLEIMDIIMTFDEELLREAGMTKSQMPEQKDHVLQLYDTMIAQAREAQESKES